MELIFKEQYLKDLYEGKKVKDKKFVSNPQLVKQYIKTIAKLQSIGKVEQLYQIKSLHYEKKIGNLEGKSAVWINNQYRLIFEEVLDEQPPHEIKILALEKISKHYED
jgi:proteic killer suppression protein